MLAETLIRINTYRELINFLNHVNNNFAGYISWDYNDLYNTKTINAIREWFKEHTENYIVVHFHRRMKWRANRNVRYFSHANVIVWSVNDYIPISDFEKDLLEYKQASFNAIIIDSAFQYIKLYYGKL